MENQPTVHGSIFFLLKKFVVHMYSIEVWEQLLKDADVKEDFIVTEAYPLSSINTIVQAASKHSGIPVSELQEKFGEFCVPDLFALYGEYLNPSWKTLEVLEHTEKVFHGAVRQANSTAHPPILHVFKVNDHLMIIDYHSKRRMGSLAVGIIKGIAKYYQEEDKFEITPTTNPEDERVQIRITTK